MELQARFDDLVTLYRQAVERFAQRPLFGTKTKTHWQWMSYEQFSHQVDLVRSALRDAGIRKGDRVACISNNCSEWAICAFATYGLGAVFVPMYENQHPDDWKFIIGNSGAKWVFVAHPKIEETVQSFRASLPELASVVVFDDLPALIEKYADAACPVEDVDQHDLATIIYTSGTTGTPKGVELTHRNLAHNVGALIQIFPIAPEDRSLTFLPWAHCFGQTVELYVLLAQGASMGVAESVDRLISNLAEVRPTLLFSVPRIYNRIYAALQKRMEAESPIKKALFEAALRNANERRTLELQGRRSLVVEMKHTAFDRLVFAKIRQRFGGKLKYAISGGAAISKSVAEFIDNLGITVYEGYGLTETSPVITANRPGARRLGSVGQTIPGVRVTIDTSATEGGAKNEGEIVCHGHNVMRGYYKLPEETKKVMTADGGLRTGDLGYVDDEGFLYITGRIKEQYKLENGKFVIPDPLEEQIKLSPLIVNLMIHGENRPYNIAIVVPDLDRLRNQVGLPKNLGDEALLQDKQAIRLVQQAVDDQSKNFRHYERVKKIALVLEDFTPDNGMLTPSLKVKRRVVKKHYEKVISALYEG